MKDFLEEKKVNDIKHEHSESECPVHKSLEIIGKKWTVLIVKALVEGSKRYCGIQENLGNIAPGILSSRLRELEEQGIIKRDVIPEIPVRVEYSLTEKGIALKDVIDSINHWGTDWM